MEGGERTVNISEEAYKWMAFREGISHQELLFQRISPELCRAEVKQQDMSKKQKAKGWKDAWANRELAIVGEAKKRKWLLSKGKERWWGIHGFDGYARSWGFSGARLPELSHKTQLNEKTLPDEALSFQDCDWRGSSATTVSEILLFRFPGWHEALESKRFQEVDQKYCPEAEIKTTATDLTGDLHSQHRGDRKCTKSLNTLGGFSNAGISTNQQLKRIQNEKGAVQ